jgi:hypothetical protein
MFVGIVLFALVSYKSESNSKSNGTDLAPVQVTDDGSRIYTYGGVYFITNPKGGAAAWVH